MNWLLNMRVHRKIICVHVLSLLLLSGIVGVIIWDSLDRMMVENMEKRGLEIANHLAALSSDYILMEDYYALYDLLSQTVEANADIRYIVVLDSNNQVISHTFPNGVPHGLLLLTPPADGKAQTVLLASEEGYIHDQIVPIEQGAIGFVRVGIGEAAAKAFIANKVTTLVLATLFVCLLATGVLWSLMRIITRPVDNLVWAAGEITAGRLEVRAEVRGSDEFAQLAVVFNRMADKLIAQGEEKARLLSDREGLLQELQEKDQMRNQLLQKFLSAQEEERQRISRELHDETSQALTSLMVAMRVLAEEAGDEAQREALLTSREVAAGILQGIREMAVDLRPPALDELGLLAAIRKYVAKLKEWHGLTITLHEECSEAQIHPQIAVALYRIVQEGLTNVIKHAKATTVQLTLRADARTISLLLEDNGRGFSEAALAAARQKNRIGLYGMQERAELLGGRFVLQAAEGKGTKLFVTLPLQLEEGRRG